MDDLLFRWQSLSRHIQILIVAGITLAALIVVFTGMRSESIDTHVGTQGDLGTASTEPVPIEPSSLEADRAISSQTNETVNQSQLSSTTQSPRSGSSSSSTPPSARPFAGPESGSDAVLKTGKEFRNIIGEFDSCLARSVPALCLPELPTEVEFIEFNNLMNGFKMTMKTADGHVLYYTRDKPGSECRRLNDEPSCEAWG